MRLVVKALFILAVMVPLVLLQFGCDPPNRKPTATMEQPRPTSFMKITASEPSKGGQ